MKYIYIEDCCLSDGKPFNSLEEAVKYLYQRAQHSKIHLNGVLKDMKVTEDSFTLYIEECSFFMGESIDEIGRSIVEKSIRVANEGDSEKIKRYFERNKL